MSTSVTLGINSSRAHPDGGRSGATGSSQASDDGIDGVDGDGDGDGDGDAADWYRKEAD